MQKKIVNTPNAPAAIGPYSQAVLLPQMVYTSGQIGLDPASGELQDGLEAQTHQAFQNLNAILQEAGSHMGNVVKFTLFLTDLSHFALVNDIMKTYLAEPFPARSTVGVKELPKGAVFEIEAIAIVD